MKPTTQKLSTLFCGMATILGVAVSTQAQAFLTDTSQQKVILIGKGGDPKNMQTVKVQEIKQPQNTHAYTQPISPSASGYYDYQNPPINSDAVRTQITKSVAPAQPPANPPSYAQSYGQPSTSYAQNYSYGQPASSSFSPFERLALTTNSAAVAVFDVATGKPIYEKNINAARSIASITKMMTAMVVLDSGQDLRDELVISSEDLRGAKTASTNLKAGDRLSRSEFMLMMLMKSENPAAKTLATHYHGGYRGFINAMNQKAQSLGMYNTKFSDSSGLDPRNVSTANDLIKMMREISANPRYQTIRNFSTAPNYDFYITNYNTGNRTYKAGNTSSLVRSGEYPISASKTGFIREAGHCVVMETHVNGRPAIIVLLGAQGSTNRWNDAKNIIGQLAYL